MRNGMYEDGIDEYGYKAWYKDDKLHRLDGPAVERIDGTKEWWKEGKRHRLDGPAVENSDGNKVWCIKGVLVYSDRFGLVDRTHEFELSNEMKNSLIKYKLGKLS